MTRGEVVGPPWGGIPLKDQQVGYRPWVKCPKALEEDPEMGWYLGATIGSSGRFPQWIATGVTSPLCGDGWDDVPCFIVATGGIHDLIA